jgi:hypothetical protein
MEYLDTLKDSLERDERVVLSAYSQAWPHGESLLHWLAAYRGPSNLALMRYILEGELVHVNQSNYRGATPLYYAAISSNPEAITLLLSHSANPRIRSAFSGDFPLDAILKREYRDADLKARMDRARQGREEEAKECLLEYEGDTVPLDRSLAVKDGFTLYQSYGYRVYMYALATLDVLYAGERGMKNDLVLEESLVRLYQQEGLEAATREVQALMRTHWTGRLTEEDFRLCLACSRKDSLKRCSRCKRAYFCSLACQRSAINVHRFDCHSQGE